MTVEERALFAANRKHDSGKWALRIQGLYFTYKQAGQDFAAELYIAAIGTMPDNQLDSIARPKAVQRMYYGAAKFQDRIVVEESVVLFFETGGYVRLANAIKTNASHLITADMLKALMVEILARGEVDDWYEQQNGRDAGGSKARHAHFTNVLRRIVAILLPAFSGSRSLMDLLQEAEQEVRQVSQGL